MQGLRMADHQGSSIRRFLRGGRFFSFLVCIVVEASDC